MIIPNLFSNENKQLIETAQIQKDSIIKLFTRQQRKARAYNNAAEQLKWLRNIPDAFIVDDAETNLLFIGAVKNNPREMHEAIVWCCVYDDMCHPDLLTMPCTMMFHIKTLAGIPSYDDLRERIFDATAIKKLVDRMLKNPTVSHYSTLLYDRGIDRIFETVPEDYIRNLMKQTETRTSTAVQNNNYHREFVADIRDRINRDRREGVGPNELNDQLTALRAAMRAAEVQRVEEVE